MMPVRLSRIQGRPIILSDGAQAHVAETWYDDDDWVARYMTVEVDDARGLVPAGEFCFDDHLRLSLPLDHPALVARLERTEGPHGSTTMSQPDELAALRAFGAPAYWGGTGLWGDAMTPVEQRSGMHAQRIHGSATPTGPDGVRPSPARLASTVHAARSFLDASVRCPDGVCATITDAIVDGETWSLRFFLAAGRDERDVDPNWALISPFWIIRREEDGTMTVPFTSSVLLGSPAYNPDSISTRDEKVLSRYYGFAHNGWQLP